MALSILRLGHAELRVTDLGAARAFYVDIIGMVEVERDADQLLLRASEEFDLWTLALTRAKWPGLAHFALRLGEAEDLERLERLYREEGLPCRRVPAGTELGQGDAVRAMTPDGFPIEFYHSMEQISTRVDGITRLPMRFPGLAHGHAPTRIDHLNLRTADIAKSLDHWGGQLGFRISEYIRRDGDVFAAWMRRKTGNHDVAFLEDPTAGLHHVGYMVAEGASLIRLADALADHGYQSSLEFGPGRHGLSNALFLYVRDPSGNRFELYTGDYVRDLDLDPIEWDWEDYDRRGRLSWSPGYPEQFSETLPLAPDWPELAAFYATEERSA